MNWQTVFVHWKTSLGGAMIAVPSLLTAAGFTFSPSVQHWVALCGGVGALLLGGAAADAITRKP